MSQVRAVLLTLVSVAGVFGGFCRNLRRVSLLPITKTGTAPWIFMPLK